MWHPSIDRFHLLCFVQETIQTSADTYCPRVQELLFKRRTRGRTVARESLVVPSSRSHRHQELRNLAGAAFVNLAHETLGPVERLGPTGVNEIIHSKAGVTKEAGHSNGPNQALGSCSIYFRVRDFLTLTGVLPCDLFEPPLTTCHLNQVLHQVPFSMFFEMRTRIGCLMLDRFVS